jgi:uncharacterized ferritin-like protein (DUF455 family)
MNHIDVAVHATIYSSGMTAKKISTRMGMSHQVLINKANTQSTSHKLNLREAVAIMLLTGSYRILNAIETELDIKKRTGKPSPDQLVHDVLKATGEVGEVALAVNEALKDGRFTPQERERCRNEIDEAIECLTRLRASVVDHP